MWRNGRIDIPSASTRLEEAAASVSATIELCPGKPILGIDDELLRHASTYNRAKNIRVHNGKKGVGLRATTVKSALSSITFATHYSVGGDIPEVATTVLEVAVGTHNTRLVGQALEAQLSLLIELTPLITYLLTYFIATPLIEVGNAVRPIATP